MQCCLMFDEDAFVTSNDFEEDEIDIFAELGVANSRPMPAISRNSIADENLAILMGKNEQIDDDLPVQTSVQNNEDLQMLKINDETISKLLEVLVKDELNSMDEQEIIEKIPAKAKLKVDSTKVRKFNDDYEISVILDVDGSGPVRPFAKVRSENNMLKLSPAPSSIPNIWIPLYNALRDLLAKAMQSLSSTKFTIDKNFG